MDPSSAFDKLSALSTQLLDSAAEYSKMDIPVNHNIARLLSTLRQSITVLETIEYKDFIENDDDIDDDCDPEIVGICDMLMNIKYENQDELATFDDEYAKVWGRIDAARVSKSSSGL